MMPAYTTARFSIFFFGSFLTLGTFFLLNVVIAVVCNEYNAAVETEAEEKRKFREERLKRAFAILDGPQPTGGLPRKLMEDVFAEVSHYRRLVSTIDKDRGRVIFGALDTNRDGMISEEEFMRLGSLLAVRFKRARSRVTFVGRLIECCFPHFFNSSGFRSFEACVRHRGFDLGIDCMLLLNAVLLIVEELPILTGENDSIDYSMVPWARPVAAVFTSIFSVEMCVKLLALGWHDCMQRAPPGSQTRRPLRGARGPTGALRAHTSPPPSLRLPSAHPRLSFVPPQTRPPSPTALTPWSPSPRFASPSTPPPPSATSRASFATSSPCA